MDFTNQASVNQAINQSRANGLALQNQYNAQSGQLQGQYGQDVNQANSSYGNANQANQNYQNFNAQLPNEYKNLTNQYATGAGYNANTMQNTMNNAMTLSEANASLPQAVNQMGNYSGATSGQIAQNYANMAPNLAQALAGANTMLSNQQNAYQMGIGAAQNITNQQGTNFGNLLTGSNQTYNAAVNQMQSAGQIMASIENLQQQQGFVTAQQVAQYQNARSGYVSAQAAIQQAQAAAQQAQAATTQANAYANYYNLMTSQAQTKGQQPTQSQPKNIPIATTNGANGSNLNAIQSSPPSTMQQLFGNTGTQWIHDIESWLS
jgi:hypothetical protein